MAGGYECYHLMFCVHFNIVSTRFLLASVVYTIITKNHHFASKWTFLSSWHVCKCALSDTNKKRMKL